MAALRTLHDENFETYRGGKNSGMLLNPATTPMGLPTQTPKQNPNQNQNHKKKLSTATAARRPLADITNAKAKAKASANAHANANPNSNALKKLKPQQRLSGAKSSCSSSITDDMRITHHEDIPDEIERVHFTGADMEDLLEKRKQQEINKDVEMALSYKTEIPYWLPGSLKNDSSAVKDHLDLVECEEFAIDCPMKHPAAVTEDYGDFHIFEDLDKVVRNWNPSVMENIHQ